MEVTNNNVFDNNIKIYAIICLFFINLALITISQIPTTTSYEISIFSAYPIYVWIFFFIALALGIFIIFSSSKKKWKVFGISINVFLTNIFVLLPFLRNYILYGRADVISHLSYINDLIATKEIVFSNFYPFSHLFVTNFHYFTNVNVNTIILIIPAIFFVIYILGLYLFTREITSNKSEALLVLVLGCVLIFSYYTTMFLPTQLSFSLIPLILFLLFRSKKINRNNVGYSILFLVFLMIMPFFHPLTSINLIILFVVVGCALLITWMIGGRSIFETKNLLNPLLLLAISFFTWISSKTIFNRNVIRMYDWLVNEIGTPTIDSYTSVLSFSSINIVEIIQKMFLSHGVELVYVCSALIGLGYFVNKAFKERKLDYNIVLFILGFIAFTFLSAVFLFGAYGISNPLREFVYVLFFATMISGIFFYRISHNNGIIKRNYKYFLIIFVVSCSALGLYSSYYSISSGETNLQVTNAEFTGMNWFFSNWDNKIRIYDLDKSSRRFSDINKGIDFTKTKSWMFRSAPSHLNITNETGYFILNSYIVDRYTVFWPDNPYFIKEDFNSLEGNVRVDKIYDNSDNKIWIVK